MIRLITLVILAFAPAACASASRQVDSTGIVESDVEYLNGDVKLAAALLLPAGKGPFPAAVILQGSGDSDRSNLWSRSWATALASRGIAALLTDKRGSGKSGGDWKVAGLDVLAGDGVAGVEFLRKHPSILPQSVGVIGLSQGGHLAPLTAVQSRNVAFVVDISGSTTTSVEQVNHEMRNTFRNAGLDSAAVEAGMRLQGLAEGFVARGDWESYRPAMDAALASPLRPVAEGFPQTRDSWVWGWWRLNASFDPIEYWKKITVPGLVMFGSLDEQDNVPVRESVRRLEALSKSNLTVRVFEGTGHALFDNEAGTRTLRADAVGLLTDWIRAQQR